VTKALGSYVTSIRGIDISENMVQHYNEAARSSGLTNEQAHAVVGDLIGSEPSAAELQGPEFYNFDVAAIGLGFHHFEDPPLAVKRLGERLKAETGVLIIVDFLPFEHNPEAAAASDHNHGHSHGHGSEQRHHQHEGQEPTCSAQHTIKHNGFTAAGIQHLFASAGLSEDFAFDILPEPAVFDFPEGRKERTIFIAKARKAPTFWSKVKTWVSGSLDAIGEQKVVRADGDGGSGPFQPKRDVADADGGGTGAFGLRKDGV
jgi:SAM-dependent methyltransferase